MSTPPELPQDRGLTEPVEAVPNSAAKPAPKSTASLLPPTKFAGPIPWVIAILIALVIIAAVGGLSLRNLAESARADLSGALTVQIIEAEPAARYAQAAAAGALLGTDDMVRSVRIVPEAELAELLEPWLGAGAASEEVPIPALIDVELTRAATAEDLARLQAQLDGVVSGARIDAQSSWLRPVYDALAALQYLALALIALIGFATAAAVWLAARSAFANHRETVEIIHLLGGTDQQVTRVFQRFVLRDAAFGAVVGLVLGLGAVWLLARQFAALDSGMIGGGVLTLGDWLIIAAIPVAGVLLALITARITINLALRSML